MIMSNNNNINNMTYDTSRIGLQAAACFLGRVTEFMSVLLRTNGISKETSSQHEIQ